MNATRRFPASSPEGKIIAAIGWDRVRFASAVRNAELYRLIWVKIKIIDGCNIRCVMCNHWRRDGYRRVFLTYDRLMELADELAAMGTRHVNWSGGEPTIRKDLPEVIGRLTALQIQSSIITNGTLMTQDYASRLLKARTAGIGFSLESSEPKIHDKVVGIEGAFEKLIQGARYLMAGEHYKPFLMANTVLTSINTGPGLVGLVPLAAELGILKINLSCIYSDHLSETEQADLTPSDEQVMQFQSEYLPRMRQLGDELGVEVVTNGAEEPQNHGNDFVPIENLSHNQHIMGYYQHSDRSCYLPFYHCTIDFNGNVTACCHMRDGSGLLGNINEMPLRDILGERAAKRLRTRLTTADMPEPCGTCAMQITENQAIDEVLGSAVRRLA